MTTPRPYTPELRSMDREFEMISESFDAKDCFPRIVIRIDELRSEMWKRFRINKNQCREILERLWTPNSPYRHLLLFSGGPTGSYKKNNFVELQGKRWLYIEVKTPTHEKYMEGHRSLTPAPQQPHTQRCETCSLPNQDDGNDRFKFCPIVKHYILMLFDGKWVPYSQWSEEATKAGCASHTPTTGCEPDYERGRGYRCEQCEVRNDVKFCHFHDAPTDQHDRTIREEATQKENKRWECALTDLVSNARMVDLNGETGDECEEMVDAESVRFIIKSLRKNEGNE